MRSVPVGGYGNFDVMDLRVYMTFVFHFFFQKNFSIDEVYARKYLLI